MLKSIQAGEEVVLRQLGGHARVDQREVLPRPGAPLQVVGGVEEHAVGVDLRAVRPQGGVALVEEAGDVHLRGDVVVCGDPRRDDLRVGHVLPGFTAAQHLAHRVHRIEHHQASGERHVLAVGLGHRGHRAELPRVEAAVVVDLRDLPRGPGLGVLVREAGGPVGLHRHGVGLQVVRVRVAADLVVGDEHVRAEPAHERDQRGRRIPERDLGEAVRREGRQRIPLGQARVEEAEPGVPDAEDARGLGHLLAAHGRDVPVRPGGVPERRVEQGAGLAARARDDHDLGPGRRVGGHRAGPLRGLVVRVGVHRHEAQPGGGRQGGACGGLGLGGLIGHGDRTLLSGWRGRRGGGGVRGPGRRRHRPPAAGSG